MQLRYEKSIKNRVITLELETASFLSREVQALEKFGEPLVGIEKMYRSKYPVSFEKKIRTGFKVKVKFDGRDDVNEAAEAANEFFEEIQEVLTDKMAEIMDKLDELESGFEAKKGFIDIKY